MSCSRQALPLTQPLALHMSADSETSSLRQERPQKCFQQVPKPEMLDKKHCQKYLPGIYSPSRLDKEHLSEGQLTYLEYLPFEEGSRSEDCLLIGKSALHMV